MELSKDIKYDDIPNFDQISKFLDLIMKYLFVGYFEFVTIDHSLYKNNKLTEIEKLFKKYINPSKSQQFIDKLPIIDKELSKDLDFFYESDPAAKLREEIVFTYPGYKAIIYYRIAHLLLELDIPYFPRIITEKAHSLTGIDINPGAKIGVPFFIDHGTGVVIGETAIIGDFVKIYHGVTLGALSLSSGRKLANTKRHPTIGNHVVIYSGASILGGDTVIGDNVTIGSNVFIVNSVLKDTKVIYQTNSVKYIK